MTYQQCVDYLLSVPLFAKKLGTDNLNQILEIMGHPERSYRVIHVAGTNGKGSTCSFLASILEQSGKRVGLFTSPHLERINERIRINQNLISDSEFTALFEEVMEVVRRAKEKELGHPSFFEFVFLMGAVYFQKQKVDYAVFETGMGGRLDATNVVQPVLTVITSVGLDHTRFLGDTIEEIASEKAGIIKQGIPVVFFDHQDGATPVISKYCKKMGAKLFVVEKSQCKLLKITEKTIDFSFENGYYRYDDLKIRKTALYQIENAMTAVKAFEILNMTDSICGSSGDKSSGTNYRLTDTEIENIRAGLLNMVWPCRMERVARHIYIDGAHNEQAIEAFCKTLETMFRNERKILLFAVSEDKDYRRMIRRLCEISFEEIIIVRYRGDRAAQLETVEAAFRHFSGSKITTFDDIEAGFSYGKSHVEDSYLFCAGSLYLAGNLLSLGV
ncbi:MAG: bifunctional folylpolyglutamate synthase/dihydrofolate synthase [Lachnospiraceae bacterium]|nr:bifunctional folylpolyglutamate synthase/dihydrofolate synthase [Lachnospiraceae bacterium]